MANKLMYFGTKERMTWIPCPAINAGISTSKWGTTSEYLNGGAASRFSAAAHGDYSFAWSPMPQEDIYSVLDYFDGTYGEPPYYFLSPFATTTNVLPAWLAAPRVAAAGGPSLIVDEVPTLSATATNTLGYPTQSAVYNLDAGNTFATYDFPVPPGYTFHLGVKGSASGTAAVRLNGIPISLGLVTSTTRVTEYVTSSWATITINGTGTLTLAGMIAVVVPTGTAPPTGGFVSGRGNSGVALKSNPVRTGYSAALENASVGATVDLIETGGWK